MYMVLLIIKKFVKLSHFHKQEKLVKRKLASVNVV